MLALTKCSLRPICEEDLKLVLQWRNSDRIRSYMYSDHIITWEEHQNWFAKLQSGFQKYHLIFTYDTVPLGCINISQMDQQNNLCHWGFYIGAENAQRGSGMVMGFLGISYIFSDLGIRKICGEALAFNEASVAYHKKLGFQQEGYFREHVFKQHKYEDVFRFGLLSTEWELTKHELKRHIFLEGE